MCLPISNALLLFQPMQIVLKMRCFLLIKLPGLNCTNTLVCNAKPDNIRWLIILEVI